MTVQTKPENEVTENTFIPAVMVKDEHRNIKPGAIAEREYLINTQLIGV